MVETISYQQHMAELLRLMQALSDERHRAVEKQLEAANEWRTAMKDREALFASKAEVTIELASVSKRLTEISSTLSGSAGARQGIGSVGTIVAAFIGSSGVIAAVVMAILTFARH